MEVPNIVVHPFDIAKETLLSHRDLTYKQPKNPLRSQSFKPAEATVQEVIESIKSMMNLPQSSIENLQRQMPQSLMSEKMTYADFLDLQTKEAFFREVLTQA
jgi:hypothetical protein